MENEDLGQKRSRALQERGSEKPETPEAAAETANLRLLAEKQIDEFMRSVGYKEPREATDEQGWRHLHLGSADGQAGVVDVDGELFLRTQAFVMDTPSDGDLILPLMRELLEINCGLPLAGRLAIAQSKVWAEVMYPAKDAQADAVARCIHQAMELADRVDDSLVERYGGTTKKRVTP